MSDPKLAPPDPPVSKKKTYSVRLVRTVRQTSEVTIRAETTQQAIERAMAYAETGLAWTRDALLIGPFAAETKEIL